MSNAANYQHQPPQPHIALFPTAGMGHLTPFLCLAGMLASRNCIVTLIVPQPTVSAAESSHISSFFTTYPHIKRLDFQILPYNSPKNDDDPFFVQREAINRSIHLIHPLLYSSSPTFTAIFSDFLFSTNVTPIADDLGIPNFIFITTCARFFSLIAYYPFLISTEPSTKMSTSNDNQIQIPGLAPLPVANIPPPLLHQADNLFTSLIASNAPSFSKAKSILFNTFDWFELETITAFNDGKVLANFPPVLPIGPFDPYELEQGHNLLPWLDNQPAESVVYISFGSRTAMSKDQIEELANGLERSGHRFLWVLKANKVDKEDEEELEELLSYSFIERTKDKGIVVKGWVRQKEILNHSAIGGFVSHCGWNSVMEAARRGVPMLAWPQHGDQKINAELVEKAGLGLWERDWDWGGEWGGERLVKEEEIGEKVAELMEDGILRAKARKVGEEARKAVMKGGSSEKALTGLIESLKPK